MINTSRVLWILTSIYVVLCVALAFNPVNRSLWFVENLTIWIVLSIIFILYLCKIRFSSLAYVLMFVPLYLHTIGGHYTFSNVPFGFVTDLFDFERNHFDRVGHFAVGMYAFAIAELLTARRLVTNKFLLFTYPIFLIATIAMTYEIVEWIYAVSADAEAGIAYLGSQGDVWDAQKDMLSDTLGAIVATIFFFIVRRPKLQP